MTWNLFDTPCFTDSETGMKAPGAKNEDGNVIADRTCFAPMVRAEIDRDRDRFIVLLPSSVIVVPESWIPKTREQIQSEYGVDSPYDLYPLPAWEV
jgi:hypothetical protein